jgi:hypothetical protein
LLLALFVVHRLSFEAHSLNGIRKK